MAQVQSASGSGKSLGHSLALCRLEDVRYDAFLTNGESLIRVLARDGGTVWFEDALDDEQETPPRRGSVSGICRNYRVVEPEPAA